jgi:hypothetical protein
LLVEWLASEEEEALVVVHKAVVHNRLLDENPEI